MKPIIAFAALCSAVMVSLPVALVMQPVPEMTLAELVLRAGEEADKYHREHDVKPVILYSAKELRRIRIMSKEQKRQAYAELFASEGR